MPKTTKTTRKASSASAKKSGLKRRFDLANKKVQFLVVIGIVAVLGGGYFTVKSFASTVVYTRLPNQLKIVGGSSCTHPIGSDPAKNISQTLDIACPRSTSSIQFVSSMNPRLSGFHDTCVTAKGSGKIIVTMTNGNLSGTSNWRSKDYQIKNDGQYHTYCSGSLYSNGSYGVNSYFSIDGNALVKVSQLQVYKTASQTPTPTPDK